MKDLKMILAVVGGCVALVFLMIFGLSRLSGESANVDQARLVEGSKLSTSSGEVKVTVVDFSDMECPACKTGYSELRQLVRRENVRFVFRHYPLRMHKHSVISAKAVEAARQMGKGWEMVELLFDKQEEWSGVSDIENKLTKYASSLGLDEKVFSEKLGSSETEQVVAFDRSLAEGLSLSGTPSIFVNGVLTSPQFVMSKVEELLKQ